jgi:hypothetical protein
MAILIGMSDTHTGFSAGDIPDPPGHAPSTAAGVPGGAGRGKGTWSRGKRAAVMVAVCAMAGGGAFAITQAAAGSQPLATQAVAAQAPAGPASAASAAGQTAVLRDVLGPTGIRRLSRLRFLGGMHGQFTYQAKGKPVTLAFERGVITSVGGGDVVVRAADGTTWTWVLTGASVVREQGTKEPQGALAKGQAVFAGGPVSNGTRDARLIVIRKARTAPAPAGAA